MKIAIIGNGILGMMSARAWLYANPNAEISLIGPSDRPGSATRAAAAMLNSFTELEGDSLKTDLDRFKFDLSRAATAVWPEVFQEICHGSEITYGFGTYVLNNAATDDLDDENFAAVERFCQEYDEPHEIVAPRDIPNYHPDSRHRALKAIYLKREGWVNPKQFLDKLTDTVRSNPNARLIDAQAVTLVSKNGALSHITLDNGETIEADQFILCNGASLTKLLESLKEQLPVQRLFYGVGMSIELQSKDNVHTHCVRTTNRGLACGVYSVPYGKDRTLVGASNYISPWPLNHGHAGSAYTLLKSAMDQINSHFSRASLVNVNVGWRPTTSDTYPLFGRTSLNNLWILGGTKRDGFHLSPIICRDLVSAMSGQDIDPRYSQLAPERKLIRNISREAAIAKAVRHQINASYQHDFVPARNRMVEQLKQSIQFDLETLHDKLGATDWGIPPELVDMYRYGHIPA
ncbi:MULTISPECIES: FAD-binding oxidoreductase [unclassified Herbaspirillum]|uniref:NAD(P)/FAD-dependent oxidoreductase n=1 Tax=unclassified Herbaspirillum TaxID=2624150 RepID=UPI0011536F57|nr:MULTISPECIES: FAD-dependent oxidoreductase [unclassified Herbaspirillum]MBB5390097.1 glycine/D-amino acid oxidase-like deaminating enzyme [Herbaspirillum sp. SJZ102]TQK09404.1 glycine/D-amino acid oxidase-like deaminating enzyme [Herbaspirillum sp. SJZ130]TQK13909.1 glycine/D-amino acid oxidase-like deaminating enzyme [Herbaspirillum sp. SJZ106]TWC69633.1 glycine/D-amino acid oxidase-like deaminating enzyme [Herbaspirillum sp. SJZ099]